MNDSQETDNIELLRQQTILARFGELALKSDSLDEILTEACRLIGEALGTDLAKVMELQADGKALLVRAGVGWKPGVVGAIKIQVTEHTSEGYALKTGEPMISPDIETEARFNYPPFLTENGVRAVANVAIIGSQGRQAFGVLQIDSRTPRHFTDANVTFLRGYANLLAAAVDRLRVIREMRDGGERLRLALETGKSGSWDFDLVSGTATSTPGTMQIFGYAEPPPEWGLDTFLDHVLPEDRERVTSTFREAADTNTEWRFECRILRQNDGILRWIEAQGRAIGESDNTPPTHLLGIVTDITERKIAEEALLRSNEVLETRVIERTRELVEAHDKLRIAAEEREHVDEALRQSNKMEAVGQLTGGLAHDFNNLLAGITGSLGLIRIRVAQGRTAEIGRYIDTALGSANRAAALTQRLLAFARRQTLDPKPTNANRLVGGMVDLFSRTVGPSIQIETKLASEAWSILCDPNQLESALLNLIINARDALPDGGCIMIETATIILPDRRGAFKDASLGALPPGDYMALSVSDTGMGMNPDVLTRAFDPFFTTKPLGQGTGLGLSMVHGFVQQSGGCVHLASEEGHGTTVTIYLPRHFGAVDGESINNTAASPPLLVQDVVLVVEDEPPVRMIVTEVLSDLGYKVLEAVDGRSGLHILETKTHIDLLLTDVGLPGGMNGRQLADAARQLRPTLKVLFMTGYAGGAAVGNNLMDPGMQVLTKPFTIDSLVAKVQETINSLVFA